MIEISFTEPDSAEWHTWRQDCAEATRRLEEAHQNGEALSINERLYKKMGAIYRSSNGPFSGKCAYCEAPVSADQSIALDHFRPKGAIHHLSGERVKTRASEIHPGYFWLAYDWMNLLPACNLCNSPSSGENSGHTPIGKRTYFPLIDESKRAEHSGGETNEEPLLLHPVQDSPTDHLSFKEDGTVDHLSERGEVAINILGLNARERLCRLRRETIEQVTDNFGIYFLDLLGGNIGKAEERKRKILEFDAGSAAFSAAGRVALARARKLAVSAPGLLSTTQPGH